MTFQVFCCVAQPNLIPFCPKVLVMRGLTHQLHQCLVRCLSCTWKSVEIQRFLDRGVFIPHEWLEAENIARKKSGELGKPSIFFLFFSWCSCRGKKKKYPPQPTILGGRFPHYFFRFSGANCWGEMQQIYLDLTPTQDAGSSTGLGVPT